MILIKFRAKNPTGEPSQGVVRVNLEMEKDLVG